MKRGILLIIFSILFLSIVTAQGSKLDISTIKDSYQPGDDITLKASLLDSSNNPLSADIVLVFENADKTKRLEVSVPSNTIANVKLGSNVPAGYWSVTGSYETLESKALFIIESKEQVSFDVSDNVLTISNTGNIPYVKDVQVRIGDTVGVKSVGLGVGEKTSFTLIAPDGEYSIEIVVDGKTIFSKSNVALTGNAIGVLEEKVSSSTTPISGTRFSNDQNDSLLNFTKKNLFTYIFVLVIIGAGILLAIERNYNRLNKKPSN